MGETVSVELRIQNFEEFHKGLPQEEQVCEAKRCMSCGIPFCQAGTMIAQMASGCPLHNLVPETNDLVSMGNLEHVHRAYMNSLLLQKVTRERLLIMLSKMDW